MKSTGDVMSRLRANGGDGRRQEPDSKDLIEHLRFVHFSLVALSFSILILALTQRESPVTLALRQMDRVVTLSKYLSRGMIEAQCKSARAFVRAHTADSDAFHDHFIVLPDGSYKAYSADQCIVASWQAKNNPYYAPGGNIGTVVLGVKADDKIFINATVSTMLPNEPRTLDEFQRLWDVFIGNQEIIVPTQLDVVWRPANFSAPKVTYVTTAVVPKGVDPSPLIFNMRPELSPPLFLFVDYPDGGAVPVARFAHVSMDGVGQLRTLLNRTVLSSASIGPFADYFPELHELTKEHGSATYAYARATLQAQSDHGEESLEAFGLKLPAGQVSAWGTITLLVVQLYFLAQLVEWHRRARLGDDSWRGVAWIGVYKGILSRVLFVASAFALPVIACIALVYQAFQRTEVVWIRIVLIAGAGMCFLLSLIACRNSLVFASRAD